MIQRFYAKNFSSIKDEIDISFVAAKITDETFYNNTFDYKNSKILKVSAFYGMNAAGKSRIVMAVAALKELVIGMPFYNLPYHPFAFDKKSKTEPITLGIEFSIENKDDSPLYRYFVSYNDKMVLFEKLDKIATQKPSLLFERNTLDDERTAIKLGATVQNNILLHAIKDTVVASQTFLSMFSQFKITDFHDAYSFFLNHLINISPTVTRFDDVLPNRITKDSQFKNFVLNLLKAADFNITDLNVGKSTLRLRGQKANIVGPEKDAIFFTHKGNCSEGSIEFLDESLGTKKIVILAAHLYPALSKPSVLVVDELESSLHPELTKLIVRCFLDETINPYNSQLIFTSHETSLLNLNLLRRDEINFVYKDKNTCGTYVRSLKDFHVRKTDSIEKSYLAGRYLTSPDLQEHFIEEQLNAERKI